MTLAPSINSANSLTVWNASSGPTSLRIVLVVAAEFVLCTGWVCRMVRGLATVQRIRLNSSKPY